MQKLEEHAGLEARKLFEKFMRDLQKLRERQEQGGSVEQTVTSYAKSKMK